MSLLHVSLYTSLYTTQKLTGPYANNSASTFEPVGASGSSGGEEKTPSLQSSPSAAEMEAAIHDDVKEAGEDAEETDELLRINAFDLINTCGGTALNRMFETAQETSERRVFRYISRKVSLCEGVLCEGVLCEGVCMKGGGKKEKKRKIFDEIIFVKLFLTLFFFEYSHSLW